MHNHHSTRPANLKLDGILLPFPTPFDERDEFDAHALRRNIELWNAMGVCGYVALGSTGERVHLDADERRIVVEAARAVVPSESTFVVGVGQESTRATIAEAHDAARTGADAVLVITPGFYHANLSSAALVTHFLSVADASPAPVMLYSIPQNTGVALTPDQVARLAEHPNIVGVKDSSGDFIRLAATINSVPDSFAVLTGNASLLATALAAGARGAILAAACLAPELAIEIYQAACKGDHEQAQNLQKRFSLLAANLNVRYGIAGLKAALDLCGYAGGTVRAPLEVIDDAGREEIKRLLERCGVTSRAGEQDVVKRAGAEGK